MILDSMFVVEVHYCVQLLPEVKTVQTFLLSFSFAKAFSPPAKWGLLDFITVVLLLRLLLLPLLQLLHHLCILSHVHFRLANSSPALRQLPHVVGTAGPQLQGSERTGHRGPQPGTVRAQWAPLDLNLGPSELSEHRWTSTARWNARRYAR